MSLCICAAVPVVLLEIPMGLIILLIVLAFIVGGGVGLYFLGKKAEKKQAEQQAQLEEHKQTIGMLIIDKKKMKIADSGLPDMVISQVPWYGKFQKLPIVKAKVGPKIMSLICDDKIFDDIPLKREVKASVSGIYIMEVRGVRGKLPPAEPKKKGLKGMIERLQEKAGAKPLK